jgi:L-2,4-diaminobutyrate decarboxylase
VLAAPSGHYSLRKAAAVMGLGAEGVRPLPVDGLGRVLVDRVPEEIAAARRRGERPIALVANACATGTGLYDDLAGLAEVCRERGLWLHVDGAHGAAALVSDRHRHLMAGLEGADSLTWDAHKMLRAPVLTTGVLFRDRATFDGLFEQDASYLFEERMRDLDPGQRTFETTKPPIGLRIVLALAMRGERGLADYVDRQYALAHRAWETLRETPGFELPYEPESNVLCFRYGPAGDRQLDLRRLINEDGAFYLSSVRIGEAAHLRAAFMSPTTGPEDVDALGATAARLAAAL